MTCVWIITTEMWPRETTAPCVTVAAMLILMLLATVTRKSSVITNLYQTQYSNTHKKSVTMRRFYVDVMIIIL